MRAERRGRAPPRGRAEDRAARLQAALAIVGCGRSRENGQPPDPARSHSVRRSRSLDAQRALQGRKILGQRRDRRLKRVAVLLAELVVGLEPAVLRPVFRQQRVDLAKLSFSRPLSPGSCFAISGSSRRRSSARRRIGLEVPEIGAAVAILFAGDLLGGDLFDQVGGAADQIFRRDGQVVDPLLQLERVGHQLVGERREAVGRLVGEQAFLDPMEADEFRVVRLLLEIVFARSPSSRRDR